MKSTALKHAASRSQQGGMTLLVGLVLLMMLTVIGTVGFRGTTMTERMTGNSLDRNVAFQSAENAGKEALTQIVAGTAAALADGYYPVPFNQGGTNGFWTGGEGATVALHANCAATTPFSWKSCSQAVGTKYANNANNAQYVIELLTENSSGGSTTRTYRITSRSTGGSGTSDVILQTNFVRVTTP